MKFIINKTACVVLASASLWGFTGYAQVTRVQSFPDENHLQIAPTLKRTYPKLGYKVLSSDGVNFNHDTSALSNGYYLATPNSNGKYYLSFEPVSERKIVTLETCLNVQGEPKPINCDVNTVTIEPISSSFVVVGFDDSGRQTTNLSRDSLQMNLKDLLKAASIQAYGLYSTDIIDNEAWSAGTFASNAANMQGLFCDSSATNCISVGKSFNGSSRQINAYASTSSDGGQTWSSASLPDAATTNNFLNYGAIGCNSDVSVCHSLASEFNDSINNTTPIDFVLSSGSWSANTSFTLLSDSSSYVVNGMKCDSDTADTCVAVGTYIDDSIASETSTSFPLILTLSNGAWTASTFSLPSGATQGFLNDISCNYDGSSIQNCVAVGSITTSSTAVNQPIAYYSSDGGQTWTESTMPTIPDDGFNASLQGVWCQEDLTSCMAVGGYQTGTDTTSNLQYPMTYQSNNSGETWQLTTAQPSITTSSQGAGILNSVYCDNTTSSDCVVVGIFGDGSKNPLSYTTTNFGASWTDISPSKASGTQTILNQVVCDASAAQQCATVGTTIASPNVSGAISSLLSASIPSDKPAVYKSADGTNLVPIEDSSNTRGRLLESTPSYQNKTIAVGFAYAENNATIQPLVQKIEDGVISSISINTSDLVAKFQDIAVLGTSKYIAVGYSSNNFEAHQAMAYQSTDGISWYKVTLPSLGQGVSASELRTINCTGDECVTCGGFKINDIVNPLCYRYTVSTGWFTLSVTPSYNSNGLMNSIIDHSAPYEGGILMSASTEDNGRLYTTFYQYSLISKKVTGPFTPNYSSLVDDTNEQVDDFIYSLSCGPDGICLSVGAEIAKDSRATRPLILKVNTQNSDITRNINHSILGVDDGTVLRTIHCVNTSCSIISEREHKGLSTRSLWHSYDFGERFTSEDIPSSLNAMAMNRGVTS